jgi:AbrB family looped-hinge helix DNA binding protein
MARYQARTSQKGQATIPAEVRRKIGLEPGGVVEFVESETGEVVVRGKKRGVAHLRGIFGPQPEPLDIDEAIAESVWEENAPGGKRPAR